MRYTSNSKGNSIIKLRTKIKWLKRLKLLIAILAYGSLVADFLIVSADLYLASLPTIIPFNYWNIATGTITISTNAINQLGQQLLVVILPLTAIAFMLFIIISHYQKVIDYFGVKLKAI